MNESFDHASPLDAELLRRLDACRASTDDFAELLNAGDYAALADDPRYAEWYRRSAAFDMAVVDAMVDDGADQTPLPAGLFDRLQAALQADAAATIEPTSSAASQHAEAVASPAGIDRRRWLVAAGSALSATAAGWALFAWLGNRGREPFSNEELLHDALALHRLAAARSGEAVPMSQQLPPTEFAFSSHVRPEVEPRWRLLAEPLAGREGVAYELAAPHAPRAALYVASRRGRLGAPALPALPADSGRAPSSTGGCSLGAWIEDDRLVVLVVEGDERRYRGFVERPQAFA